MIHAKAPDVRYRSISEPGRAHVAVPVPMARKAGPEGLGSRPVTTRWDRKGRTRLAVIDGLVNESVGFDQYERKEARQIAAPRPEPQL
jgi:hypothetical protein